MSTLFAESALTNCTCGTMSRRVIDHEDECKMFACPSCGSLMGAEHATDCADRCPHCRGEVADLDHRDGCPTLGTCAQCATSIPREDWHPYPLEGEPFTVEAFRAHLAEFHPGIEPES